MPTWLDMYIVQQVQVKFCRHPWHPLYEYDAVMEVEINIGLVVVWFL